jgi:hypothetical protein
MIITINNTAEAREYGRFDERCCEFEPSAPTVSRIVKQWKGSVTKKIGFSPWQKSFLDHIIRNERDYFRIAKYIAHNHANWTKDCFYASAASEQKTRAIL